MHDNGDPQPAGEYRDSCENGSGPAGVQREYKTK